MLDLAAPVISARAPRGQRVLRLRGVIVYVALQRALHPRGGRNAPDPPPHARLRRASSRADASGRPPTARRRLLLQVARSNLSANQRARIRLRMGPRATRLLRQALRRGGRPRVTLRLRATDAAGNPSALVRRVVRVRR